MFDAQVAARIVELQRRLTGSAPAPRGLPYLGLESTTGTGTHLLDALTTHGIFRKYELVLDLAGGLGATGRWLAGRLGCIAVVTAAAGGEAAAGRALTRRTGLRGQVHHVHATPDALPFVDARFTHAWIVETLPRLPDPRAALAETFRVVRPGGYLALQDLVHAGGAASPSLRAWRFATLAEREDAIRGTGYVDLTVRETDDASEHSARVSAARSQLEAQLGATVGEPGLVAVAKERAALAAALADGRLRVVQIVARRP